MLTKQKGQIITIDELHHHKVTAGVLAKIIDLDDVGMAQGGNSLGFTPKPFGKFWIFLQTPVDDLDSGITFQFGVGPFVNAGHTTRTNGLDNLIRTQPGS